MSSALGRHVTPRRRDRHRPRRRCSGRAVMARLAKWPTCPRRALEWRGGKRREGPTNHGQCSRLRLLPARGARRGRGSTLAVGRCTRLGRPCSTRTDGDRLRVVVARIGSFSPDSFEWLSLRESTCLGSSSGFRFVTKLPPRENGAGIRVRAKRCEKHKVGYSRVTTYSSSSRRAHLTSRQARAEGEELWPLNRSLSASRLAGGSMR